MDEPRAITQEEQNVLAMMNALDNDPATRGPMRRLIAGKFPQAKVAMPELVLEEKFSSELEALRKERAEEKAERAAADNARLLAERRRALTGGFVGRGGQRIQIADEDVPAIEKLMTEEGIASHQAAAELFHAQRQVAEPGSYRSRSIGLQMRGDDGSVDGKWLEPALALGGTEGRAMLDKVARERADETWHTIRRGGQAADNLLRQWGG